ncbi:MAG TPA: hypothetical protein VEX36_04470 [Thermoleophilaceae bacterium]|nr:hypothetical protein [Thermoleophilaceae bacterium]
MLKSILKASAAKRGARFVPGGWITMLALSRPGRSAIRGGWQQIQKQRGRGRR